MSPNFTLLSSSNYNVLEGGNFSKDKDFLLILIVISFFPQKKKFLKHPNICFPWGNCTRLTALVLLLYVSIFVVLNYRNIIAYSYLLLHFWDLFEPFQFSPTLFLFLTWSFPKAFFNVQNRHICLLYQAMHRFQSVQYACWKISTPMFRTQQWRYIKTTDQENTDDSLSECIKNTTKQRNQCYNILKYRISLYMNDLI